MNRETSRSIMGFLLLSVGVLIFLLSNPPWDTPRAATILYSVLAFLAITIAASGANRIRIDPSCANKAFAAGTIYAAIIFGGASVYYIFRNESQASHAGPAGVAQNLVALATTGIFMLLYIHLTKADLTSESLWNRRFIYPLAVTLGIVIFIVTLVFSRVITAESYYLALGYGAGSIALVSYSVAAVTSFKMRYRTDGHDNFRLFLSFILLTAATTVAVLILPSPSSLWLLTISFMGMAFILAIVATAYPYLKDIGIRGDIAYVIAIMICVIVILPFLFTSIFEAWLAFDYIIDYGTTTLIHAGGAILAGLLAYALFRRAQIKAYPHHQPIIMLLQVWSVVETALVIIYVMPMLGFDIEPLVPYKAGVAASLLLLTLASRRTLLPSQKTYHPAKEHHSIFMLVFAGFVVGMDQLRTHFSSVFPLIFNQAMDMSLLLVFSYFTLFALITFIMILVAASGGQLAFDGIAAGCITIWLVISILKANFPMWTFGWWAGEGLLAFVIAAFPITLMKFYLLESEKNIELKTRVDVYTNYLASRVVMHHRSAIDSLDVLSGHSDVGEAALESVSKALAELSHANELTKSISAVVNAERFPSETLEQFDLVESVLTAYSLLRAVYPEIPQEMAINKNTGDCSVLGNSLLVDMFYNLAQGVVARIGGVQSIRVQIEGSDEQCSIFHVDMYLDVSTEDPLLKQDLFFRYMRGHDPAAVEFIYAKRLAELFNGQIQCDVEVSSATNLIINLKISLPSS